MQWLTFTVNFYHDDNNPSLQNSHKNRKKVGFCSPTPIIGKYSYECHVFERDVTQCVSN